MDRYHVGVYDCAGEHTSDYAVNFDHALILVAHYTIEYPSKVVRVSNYELCDCDTDGLTEDEEIAIDEAIDAARAERAALAAVQP